MEPDRLSVPKPWVQASQDWPSVALRNVLQHIHFCLYTSVVIKEMFSPQSEAEILTHQYRKQTYEPQSHCPPRKGSDFEKAAHSMTNTLRLTPSFRVEITVFWWMDVVESLENNFGQ